MGSSYNDHSVISEIYSHHIVLIVLFFVTFGRNEDAITYLNFTLEDHAPKKVDVIYEVDYEAKKRGEKLFYILLYLSYSLWNVSTIKHIFQTDVEYLMSIFFAVLSGEEPGFQSVSGECVCHYPD